MGNRWFALFVMTLLALSFPVSAESGEAGVTPDSAMWGVDKAFDSVGIAFTFSSEGKARKRLEVARERLAELSQMVEEEQLDAAEEARAEHEELLSEVVDVELSSDDAVEALDAVVGIEQELLAQQAAVSELKVRIQGRLSAVQQAKLDEFLATLDGSVEGIEIRIKAKKDQTVMRVKNSVENADDILEEREGKLIALRAEHRIAQAEHELLKAEAKIARFETRVQEEISGVETESFDDAEGSTDEQESEDDLGDDSSGSDSTESVQDAAIDSMTGNFAVVTGRASGSDDERDSDDRDSGSDDQDDKDDDSDDGDDGTDGSGESDDSEKDDSDEKEESDENDDPDEPEKDESDDSDDAIESPESGEEALEIEQEFEDDAEEGSDDSGSILAQFNLTVPDREERGVEVAKLYLSEARAALDTAKSSLESEPRKAYAYATFAKKLAQRAQSGKYLKLTEEQKDAIEARKDADRLAERLARESEDRARIDERAREDRQRLAERAREDAQRREDDRAE